jgi:hypothetical protein
MSECGDVQISYLGTDPPTNAVGGSHERDLNYEEMDAEHRTILARIRDATSGKRAEPADYLMLRAQVPRGLDPRSSRALGCGDYDDGEAGDEGAAATVRISVAYTGKGCVEQASLAISCTPPFYATRTSIELGAVAGGASTPLSVPVLFKAKADVLPTSTTVRARRARPTVRQRRRPARPAPRRSRIRALARAARAHIRSLPRAAPRARRCPRAGRRDRDVRHAGGRTAHGALRVRAAPRPRRARRAAGEGVHI